MKTLAISEVLNAAGYRAGRAVVLPEFERAQLRSGLALALERVWAALAWPDMTVLEEFTPDDDGLVDRRVDTAWEYGGTGGEIGQVVNCWDEDPREDEASVVVWEEPGTDLFFPDDDLETVWVEYLPPCPDLMAGSQSEFEAVEVPRFTVETLVLTGASLLHEMDGLHESAGQKLGLAERALQRQIERAHIPARRQRMQIETR
jgi:hypothetical protein